MNSTAPTRSTGGSAASPDGPGTSRASSGDRVRLASGSIVLAVGTVVLVVGWWVGVDLVTRLHPDLVSMKANTAVGFVLAGTSLLASGRVRLVAGTLLFLLGAATALEYAGVELPIDELLADDTNLIATPYPGRPGLNTAIGFALLGPGIVLAAPRWSAPVRGVGQVLLLVVTTLSFLALLGYVLDVADARGIASATQMALHTSLMFLASAVGGAALSIDVGPLGILASDGSAGRLTRRLLPIAVSALLGIVLAVRGLTALGELRDPNLQLAFVGTLSAVVLGTIILVVNQRLDRQERVADQSRRELEGVVAAFPDVHLHLDPDLLVRAVRGDDDHLVDDRAVGRAVADVLERGIRPYVLAAITTAQAGGGRLVAATCQTLPDDDGDVRTLEARVVVRPDGHIALALRDVTELALARAEAQALADDLEIRVRERTDELERINAELGAFAHTIAHDLRSPLTTMVGMADLLRSASNTDDQMRDDLANRIHASGLRLGDMVSGLLDYAEANVHVREPVVVSEEVAWVVELLQDRLANVGATISIDADLRIASSRSAIRSVLLNLLGNSLKYRSPDRPLQLRIDAVDADGITELRVADNGLGIPPESRADVFDLGKRVHQGPEGSGIGLNTVARIVDALDGHITIEDGIDGVGITVLIRLRDADPTTVGGSSAWSSGDQEQLGIVETNS